MRRSRSPAVGRFRKFAETSIAAAVNNNSAGTLKSQLNRRRAYQRAIRRFEKKIYLNFKKLLS